MLEIKTDWWEERTEEIKYIERFFIVLANTKAAGTAPSVQWLAYRMDNRGIVLRFSTGEKVFSETSGPAVRPTRPPTEWLREGIKRSVREAGPTAPSSSVNKNEWSYFSIPPYVFMTYHRGNFLCQEFITMVFARHFCCSEQKECSNKSSFMWLTADVLLDLVQELCSEVLSGTGKANTRVCASLCPQQDSNTFPWKRVESYLNIKFPGREICDVYCLRNFNVSLRVQKGVGQRDEWR